MTERSGAQQPPQAGRFGPSGIVAAAAFLAALPGAVAGGLVAAPVMALAGLALLRPSLLMRWGSRLAFGYLFFLALIAFAGLSLIWTVWPQSEQWPKSAAGALLFAAFVAAAAALRGEDRALAERAGAAAAILLIPLMFMEAFMGFPLVDTSRAGADGEGILARNLSKGLVWLLFLAPGAAVHVWTRGRRSLALGLFAASLVVAIQIGNAAAAAASLAVPLAMIAAAKRPQTALIVLFALACLSILAAPLLGLLAAGLPGEATELLDRSSQQRLAIWAFTLELIGQSPWIGQGLDASRAFADATVVIEGRTLGLMPLHPHSAGMQLWLELGAVGAVLAALAVAGGGSRAVRAARGEPAFAAALAGVVTAAIVFGGVSFGVWQEWLWGAAASGLALAALAHSGEPIRPNAAP